MSFLLKTLRTIEERNNRHTWCRNSVCDRPNDLSLQDIGVQDNNRCIWCELVPENLQKIHQERTYKKHIIILII